MTDQKKQNEEKDGINPMVAAVAGAVVGAGVAVAGAMVLEDKNNRERVKKVLTNAKNQAIDYVEGIQKQAEDKKNKIKKELVKDKKIAKKAISSTKNSLHHVVKDAKKAMHMK